MQRNDGITALYIASQNGHGAIVDALLENDAAVDVQTNIGATALSIASYHGHTKIVAVLLAHGADADLQLDDGVTALITASQRGHGAIVDALLANGAAVDVKANIRATALIIASYHGHIKIVASLLAHGADADLQLDDGRTALDLAKNAAIENLLRADATTPVPLPQNGEIQLFSSSQRVAPLRIITRGEEVHYFVKLTDWETGAPVQTIFVRAGQTAETTVPLGSYRFKYAAGEIWLGVHKLFGDATVYSTADERFDFERQDNQVSGHSVQLILQTGGNLSVRRIQKSQW